MQHRASYAALLCVPSHFHSPVISVVPEMSAAACSLMTHCTSPTWSEGITNLAEESAAHGSLGS